MRSFRLRVNGAEHTVVADEATPLIYILRNDLYDASAHVGPALAWRVRECLRDRIIRR